MLTVHTFGDSILDSARYNDLGVDPGKLLIRNEDALFPEFRGRDLSNRGPARLEHHAVDGSTVADLPRQSSGLKVDGPSLALLTVGGNDLLMGLIADPGPGIDDFAIDLDTFLRALPIRPVLIGNVYDPTFGDDSRSTFGVDPTRARASHRRLNDRLAALAKTYGCLVDLHAHFLGGRPDWFVRTIEPSLLGASEVRRCFLRAIEEAPPP